MITKFTKNKKWIVPVLICVGILVLLAITFIAATRTLSSLESVLLQIFFFAISSGISVFGAYQLFQRAANPHARSAFRRLITLYGGLSRALAIIRSSRNLKADKDYEVSLARLEEIIVGQISTADDALEDWKDIVPEEVKQLTQAFESDNTTEKSNG